MRRRHRAGVVTLAAGLTLSACGTVGDGDEVASDSILTLGRIHPVLTTTTHGAVLGVNATSVETSTVEASTVETSTVETSTTLPASESTVPPSSSTNGTNTAPVAGAAKVVVTAPRATTTLPPPALPPIVLSGAIGPLSGAPSGAGVSLGRPAVVVKIDNNNSKARPQAGLNQADIVYEERIEGGETRFVAVFHSQNAGAVGPIRSGRTTDIPILAALGSPLLSMSGANNVVMSRLGAVSYVLASPAAVPGAYSRLAGRPAPHNLFSSTGGLYTAGGGATPPPQFDFRGAGEPAAGGTPATSVSIRFGSGSSQNVGYRWNGDVGRYVRTQRGSNHVDADNVIVAPANVIVQRVEYIDSGQRDSAGSVVPEGQLIGTGEAVVYTGGQRIDGQWYRHTMHTVTRYVDGAGAPIHLAPGPTWIALIAASGSTTSSG